MNYMGNAVWWDEGGLFLLAIALHVVLDGVAVLTAKSGLSLIMVEILIWFMAIGIVWIAKSIWKRETHCVT